MPKLVKTCPDCCTNVNEKKNQCAIVAIISYSSIKSPLMP